MNVGDLLTIYRELGIIEGAILSVGDTAIHDTVISAVECILEVLREERDD